MIRLNGIPEIYAYIPQSMFTLHKAAESFSQLNQVWGKNKKEIICAALREIPEFKKNLRGDEELSEDIDIGLSLYENEKKKEKFLLLDYSVLSKDGNSRQHAVMKFVRINSNGTLCWDCFSPSPANRGGYKYRDEKNIKINIATQEETPGKHDN